MVKEKKTHLGDQEGLKTADSDELISKEEALRRIDEMKKCKESILYFANNYFNVLSPTGDKVRIKVYKKQGEFLEKLLNNNRLVTLQSRQSGKTTSYVIFCLYQVLFQKNYRILIAANTKDTAMENLAKIKDGFEELPNWIKPSIKEWSKTKVVFNNGVSIKVSATTASSGRSQSIDLLILDEFAFVEKGIQEEFWRASLPTVSSRPLAKIVIVSTPNGVGDKFHAVWQMATNGSVDDNGSVWIGHRIDWWDRPDRDEAWHQRELRSLGSEEAFQQEYGNRFTISAGDKLITDERIIALKEIAEKSDALIKKLSIDPANVDEKLTYIEYFEYDKTHTYVLSADSAEGTGRDASVVYVLDITNTKNIKIAAKFDSSKVIPEKYAFVIYKLWCKYGRPHIMLEANSVGLAVIEALRGISRNNELNPQFNMLDIVNYNRPAGHTGIMSNNQSKSLAMINIQNLVESNHFNLILPDEELFRELPFCEKREGSGNVTYKAAKGKHDDHILALVWGLFILHKSLIEKFFTVEYSIDEDTQQKYPVIVLPLGEDISDYKRKNENGQLDNDELMALADKWKMLGDEQRASLILQRIYETETEDTGGNWGRNPYEIDQSMFSDSFRKKFFNGKYSDDSYFRPPISDNRLLEKNEEYGFGWDF